MAASWSNRIKFALAGEVLEAANPLLPGRPHRRVVDMVADSGSSLDVLELCAGTGFASRLLSQLRPTDSIVGVDISPEMIKVGRKKLRAAGASNVTLTVGDVSELPFPDASFDAVMSVFGLHEVPEPARSSAIAESMRVLRPGGLFATVDLDQPPFPANLLSSAYLTVMEPRHAKGVCGVGLSRSLTSAGFRIQRHRPARGFGMAQTLLATS